MQAGDLRQRIQIKSKTVVRNATGEEIPTYTTLATLWAKVDVIGGSETISQQQAAANVTHTVTIRYYPDLIPTMIVVWKRGDGDRTLIVHSITEDATRRMRVLSCSELVQ